MEAYRPTGVFQRGANLLQLGHSFLKVTGEGHLHGDRQVAMEILHQSQKPLESVLKCIEMNWMAILVSLVEVLLRDNHELSSTFLCQINTEVAQIINWSYHMKQKVEFKRKYHVE